MNIYSSVILHKFCGTFPENLHVFTKAKGKLPRLIQLKGLAGWEKSSPKILPGNMHE